MKNNINLNSKTDVRQLGNAIEAALKSVGKEYGVNIQYGGGTLGFSGNECKLNLRINKVATNSITAAAVSNADKQVMDDYGVGDYYGKQFTCPGKRKGTTETFIVCGYNPACRAKPIRLKRPGDSIWTVKCGLELIKHYIKLPKDKSEVKSGTLTLTPAPGCIFATIQRVGDTGWAINHEGCTAPLAKRLEHISKQPHEHAIIKCSCGKQVQINNHI